MKIVRILLCAVPLLFAAGVGAQQPVTFPSGDSTGRGLLYLPRGAGPHPALIVVHEWWGLNDRVKEQAQRYADAGYVSLAVGLYRGKVAVVGQAGRREDLSRCRARV
jgi:carboxymethylenebutenolidase